MPIRLLLPAFFLLACAPAGFDAPDRKPGERRPMTRSCDPLDDTRCHLPWPSSAFLRADPSTSTGVRIELDEEWFVMPDDASSIERADGFSRVTPVVAGFTSALDPDTLGDGVTGALRLVNAQPGHPRYGELEPLRISVQTQASDDGAESLLIGFPRRPLAAASDYVVVVLDSLRLADGTKPGPSRPVQLALGLTEPLSLDEAKAAAYHAPTRAALQKAGIDPASVVRVWDFTTRSLEGPTKNLLPMRAVALQAVAQGRVSAVIDAVRRPGGVISAVVEGRLQGIPYFRAQDGQLALDDAGAPVQQGTHEAPFRVVLPAGVSGATYPVVMYGHGAGGSFNDSSFDREVAGVGAAKVGIEYTGWTDATIIDTFTRFQEMPTGTARSTAGLLQALTDLAAIQHAMGTVVGDALSAPTLNGQPNALAGVRPDVDAPLWAGGSLGGTMGLVHVSADPTVRHAILNVPGAAWTHFMGDSDFYDLLETGLADSYLGRLNLLLAMLMSQTNWDDIDGAVWVDAVPDDGPVYLLQQSMGDPILPNAGTEMAAAALNAVQVGTVLNPVWGLEQAQEARGRHALTQYRTPATSPLSIHGFAARNTTEGAAAREQMLSFIESVFAGEPRITIPALCIDHGVGGSCDFSAP